MTILLHDLVGADPARPFSPHCWKARMALAHKGLPFESRPVTFTGIPEIENGAAKTVPVLRDGDRVIVDSFAIAEYLEDTYPDRPSLFRGEGGRALSRFVESWSQRAIHPSVSFLALMDIHDMLPEGDREYFRRSREARFGRGLEEVYDPSSERREKLLANLGPLQTLLAGQPFLGGESPLFADYVVFGALQWLRVTSPLPLFPADDPVGAWFERCLDLHGGHGRSIPAAASLTT